MLLLRLSAVRVGKLLLLEIVVIVVVVVVVVGQVVELLLLEIVVVVVVVVIGVGVEVELVARLLAGGQLQLQVGQLVRGGLLFHGGALVLVGQLLALHNWTPIGARLVRLGHDGPILLLLAQIERQRANISMLQGRPLSLAALLLGATLGRVLLSQSVAARCLAITWRRGERHARLMRPQLLLALILALRLTLMLVLLLTLVLLLLLLMLMVATNRARRYGDVVIFIVSLLLLLLLLLGACLLVVLLFGGFVRGLQFV